MMAHSQTLPLTTEASKKPPTGGSESQNNHAVWQKVRRIQIRTRRTVTEAFAGAYQSAFKGKGMQFEDVREYQPGDDVRSIDWNVTARMDRPYVKNFREERELSVMLVVDISRSLLFGSQGQQKRDRITELASVLAFSAMQSCDRVGLLLFTDRVECFLPPRKGTAHLWRLLRALLSTEPVGQKTDIGAALNYLNRVLRRRGVCFLMSDMMAAPCAKEIALTSRRHDLSVLSIRDPFEIEFPRIGLVTLRDLETGRIELVDTAHREVRERLASVVQKNIYEMERLVTRLGAQFLNIRLDRDYLGDLQAMFERKEKS